MAVSISSLAAAARVLGRHASTHQPDHGAAALAAGGRGWRFLGATEHSRAAGFMQRADQASPSIGKERERENWFCVSIKNQAEAAVELATALKNNLIGVGLSLPANNLLLLPKPAVQLQHRRTFIQLKTNLEVADNSGAKRVQCIKVLRGGKGARPGDTIIASVKDAVPRGKVKKGDVVYCIVVRAALQKLRCDGSEIKFDGNAVVLVNKQLEPIGTRVFGPISAELRQRKLDKVLALAEHIA